MQANNPPLVQFGAGGEQWWQIPAGAAIYASDGVPVGTVAGVGTAYLRAGASMMADGDLYIPLQMIAMYDAQANVVHLNAAADAVRAMAGAVPANDPASLQAVSAGTLPMAVTHGPTTVRETTIPLREQTVIVTTLPTVVKDVIVRKEMKTGKITTTETVRNDSAHVEGEPDGE
jgi:hypothetical protein